MKLRHHDTSANLLVVLIATLATPSSNAAASAKMWGLDKDVQVCVTEGDQHAPA